MAKQGIKKKKHVEPKETPGCNQPWSGKLSPPGTSFHLQVWYGSRWAGSGLQQRLSSGPAPRVESALLTLLLLHSWLLVGNQGKQKLMSSALSRPTGVSVAFSGDSRTNMAAPKTTYKKKKKKKILYTHSVIYFESKKKKRHMKQWTELCTLGSNPDEMEFSDFRRRRRRSTVFSLPARWEFTTTKSDLYSRLGFAVLTEQLWLCVRVGPRSCAWCRVYA